MSAGAMSANKKQHSDRIEEEEKKLITTRMNVVIFMALLIDLLGFTVILPIMPKLLEYYGDRGSVCLLVYGLNNTYF